MLRATAISGLSGVFLALSASAASALEPQPTEELSGLSAAEAIALFVGLPLLIIGIITALVMLPGTKGAGTSEEAAAEDADEGVTWINPGADEADVEPGTGGRGARW